MSSLRLAIKQSLEGSGSTIESEQPTTSSSRPRPRISISLKPNSRIGSIPNTNANRQRQQQQQRRRRQQQQQQPSLNTISIVMANKNNQRRKQQKLAAPSATRRHKNAVVKLPEITKCIRNSDPTLIDEFGFVEIRNALPSILIEQIYREAADKIGNLNQRSNNANSNNNTNRSSGRKRNSPSSSPSLRGGGEGTTTTSTTTATTTTTNEVEEISNALQTDVSEELFRKVKMAMEDCDIAKRTMVTVFGKKGPPTTSPSSSSSSNNNDDDDDSCSSSSIHPTNRTESNYKGYVLETPKVLITPPGSPPQLPHADDHCSSCVFCLIHLGDGQEPTRVARYREDEDGDGKKKKKEKDYPTGITVGCDRCNRTEQLPDKDFRRGVHLTNEKWHCNCTSPHTPYDFEHKLTESFSELLSENAPNLCDAYAGPPSPHQSSGDGFLGLPTLIHRGPGNPTSATESRFVLFLTLRPLYDNMKQMEKGQVSVDKLHHHYNPALQIHASCMLYNQFKKVNSIYERAGCGLDGYFGAIVGAETASLMSEVKRLKEENRKLKEKIVSVRKKHSRSGRDFDGDWTIDGGG